MPTLTTPASVTTRFLVATGESLTPPLGYLRDALPGTPLGRTSLGRTARDLLGSPLLEVAAGRPVPTPWTPRLPGLGGAPERLRQVIEASHHIVLTAVAAPSAQPRQARAARLVARTLAAAVGGVLVDLDSNQVVSDRPEPARFHLGDEWIGVFVAIDGARDAERCVRVSTSGMHRFGLPELVAREVAYGHMLTAANVLRALAHRVFADRPGSLPADETVDTGDLYRFWGARPGREGGLRVRLAAAEADCAGCEAAVEVIPTTGRGDARWWELRAGAVMPRLMSALPE
ncbi:hypothetical protein [Spirillospora sp. NPDC047279]|uniref:hypothetical protein n=1 Tax=Spirillospora sp. NPDC047279 TaxID=3155478 RepID=UPI0033F3E6EA